MGAASRGNRGGMMAGRGGANRQAWNNNGGGNRFRGGYRGGYGGGVFVGGGPYWGSPYGWNNTYAYDDSYAYDDDDAVVDAPAASGGDEAYCMRRFRSYDPGSGTYLGYDGVRHSCP
jgi:hypothetical protein